MNTALNVMNAPGSTGSGRADIINGSNLSSKDKVGKGVFKEVLLSQNPSEKSGSKKDLLKKLTALLKMEPDKLKEKLKELDSSTLQELENLLNLPFDKLLQKLQSLNLNIGSDNAELKAVEDSIKRLKNILVQELEAGVTQKQNSSEISGGNDSDGKVSMNGSSSDSAGNTEGMGSGKEGSADSSNIKEINNEVMKTDKDNFLAEEKKTDKISVNLEEVTTANKDKQNEDKLINLKDSRNTNQEISANLKNTGSDNAVKEPIVKDEFALGRVGTQNEKDIDIKALNISQAGQGDLDKTDNISAKNQFNQNGQFSDLMGQTSQQSSGINESSSAKMTTAVGNNMAGVIEQITERMQVSQPGKNQINIQLEPESLGKVNIQLKVENGEVLAKLIVESQQVKGYLEQNINGLRSNLVRQGFNIDQIYVESNDNYREQHNSQQGFQQQQQHFSQEQNQEEFTQFSYEEIESLLDEEVISELPENIIADQRWSNLNYIRHRMNLLA